MEPVLPDRLMKQPTLVRLMTGIALVILPGVAWVDYQQNHLFSMAVELFAAAENLLDSEVVVGRTPVRKLGAPRTIRAGLRLRVR